MTGINIGPEFERDVAQLAGFDLEQFDPGSLEIALVNPAGDTTVRFTVHHDVDTAALQTLIQQHTQQA